MAIKIVRNEQGNCINFHGTTRPAYWNNCLTAEVDAVKIETINVINDISSTPTVPKYEFYNIPFTEFVDANDNAFASATDCANYITEQANASASDVIAEANGHYALLSGVYFSGTATQFNIPIENIDTWIDVELAIDPLGTFDFRPSAMQNVQSVGHLGTGANGDPICFKLEGLTQDAHCSIRAVIRYDPDEDSGRFDNRLLFKRHTGTTPSADFAIEESSIAMESGADEIYANTPNIQFFIGDTIDTNGPGDAGTVQFQVKADVPGTVYVDELALFIQS
jgi:hypothetical protein